MGSVYLAEDTSLHRRVALKVIDLDDPRGLLAARLLREARILATLEHPGIVPVHEVGRLPDGRVFYAMKYVEGERLDRRAARDPDLPSRLRLFRRVCEAVAFAHDRGILHRDLKPENVMVGTFGEVWVMDWGVAKILRDADGSTDAGDGGAVTPWGSTETDHGTVLGTRGYMSPEQERGDVRAVGPRSDVYSLGAVLRTLLGENPPPPRPLLAICTKAMAPDRAQRYEGALDLAREVARFLDGSRVEAYPEGVLDKTRRLYHRHRVAVWLIAAYLVVRGALLAFLGR
jgi:serine/threonine protein kinase